MYGMPSGLGQLGRFRPHSMGPTQSWGSFPGSLAEMLGASAGSPATTGPSMGPTSPWARGQMTPWAPSPAQMPTAPNPLLRLLIQNPDAIGGLLGGLGLGSGGSTNGGLPAPTTPTPPMPIRPPAQVTLPTQNMPPQHVTAQDFRARFGRDLYATRRGGGRSRRF